MTFAYAYADTHTQPLHWDKGPSDGWASDRKRLTKDRQGGTSRSMSDSHYCSIFGPDQG